LLQHTFKNCVRSVLVFLGRFEILAHCFQKPKAQYLQAKRDF